MFTQFDDLVDDWNLAKLHNILVAHFGIPRFNRQIFDLENRRMSKIADFVKSQLSAQVR